MQKVQKGAPGYLDHKKKAEIIRTVIYFGIVAAVFLLGYLQAHSRVNVLTVVAVVGCLPASKSLVGVITRFPYPSVDADRVDEIRKKTEHLTVLYDMIITSREKVMPVDCIVISGNTVFGYTHYEKVDVANAGKHIQQMLRLNEYPDASVKVLNNYAAFLARAEGLNNIAAIEKNTDKEAEERMAALILTLSM